jgi:LTXXQ motif family protein
MDKTTIAIAAVLGVALAGCAGPHHHTYGRWGGHGDGPCDRWTAGERLERALAHTERHLDVTAEQKPAWDRLAAEVRGAVADSCAAARRGGTPADAPAALARLEHVVSASAAGLERIRPAFDALYEGLSAEQRRDLDRLFTRHRLG